MRSEERLQAVHWPPKGGGWGLWKEKQWFLFTSWCLSFKEDGFIFLISFFLSLPNLLGQVAGDRWRDTVTWPPVPNGLPAVALNKDRSTRRRRHFSQRCRKQHTTTTPQHFLVATHPTQCRGQQWEQEQPPMASGAMMPRSQRLTTSRSSSRLPIWMWIHTSALPALYSHWAVMVATSSSS